MPKPPTTEQIAARLTHGKPLSYRALDNGGMIVINAQGEKHFYTPDDVQSALNTPIVAPTGQLLPAIEQEPLETPPEIKETVSETVTTTAKRNHHKKRE